MKVLTVVGARPQFIKAAPVSRALQAAGIDETLLDTGQHYDAAMAAIFYDQLHLPRPKYQLGIGSGSHGYQTGRGLEGIEGVLLDEQPDAVLVYGDTNATLAGALAAVKLHIPVAHIEAGLRSFNRAMPEEINRVVTDHVSTWLFTPTQTAVQHLAAEGIAGQRVMEVGDVMLDAVRLFAPHASLPRLVQPWVDSSTPYILLTMHRAETTAMPEAMAAVLGVIHDLGLPVIFPAHPRSRQLVEDVVQAQGLDRIRVCEPLGYFDMLGATRQARLVLTDSGGLQKEAAFLGVPCITLRNETEWVETVTTGWNTLVGLDPLKLRQASERVLQQPVSTVLTSRLPDLAPLFGNGKAAGRIAQGLGQNAMQPA